jgi:hypothetical protein
MSGHLPAAEDVIISVQSRLSGKFSGSWKKRIKEVEGIID